MRRRDLLVMLGGAAIAAPAGSRADQRSLPVVGFLNPRSPGTGESVVAAFRRGLNEAGFSEGTSVLVEYRWGLDQPERLPALAQDLVRRKVDVIVAGATTSARSAKAATSEIPIVFTTAVDPIRLGLVASLSRPGGNVTGATFYSSVLVAKQMELLHELVPTAKTAALLVNPAAATAEPSTKDATAAARAIGLDLRVLKATSEIELESAFAALAKSGADALLVTVDPFFDSRPKTLSDLASRSSMPTVYYVREFVQAGGLISYGASLTDAYRQAGLYAGRILRGEKPGDLPVVQPTIFDLTINLRTARSLGLMIAPSILARADEVIE